MKKNIRIIPVLSIIDNKLVNTCQFKRPHYIGDPINAIKIFNDKEVDEIIITDIRASKDNKKPNFQLIKEMASECFIPLAYGGGINSYDDASKIFNAGIEKVILNTALLKSPRLITEIADTYGSQSVVCSIDVFKNIFGKISLKHVSGTKRNSTNLEQYIQKLINLGAGELFINNIHHEGTFRGYDIELLKLIEKNVNIPIITYGGYRDLSDIVKVINHTSIKAFAASSAFIYRNNNRKSILINYPEINSIKKTLNENF